MRKQLILLGIIIAVIAVAMSSIGVASAYGGKKGKDGPFGTPSGYGIEKARDWSSVDATLQLSPYYYPGGDPFITPLNKKSAESLYQYPYTGELEGRFKVLSVFLGGIGGDFGSGEPISGSVQANLTSTLNVDLDPTGGTERGVTGGDVTLAFYNGTISGRVVGSVDLEMGGLYPVPGTSGVYLHELVGGKVRLVFFITEGTGAYEGAIGMLTIKGDPVAGASVKGKINLPVPASD